ncbi:MAG: type II secretion system protein [Woeseiaceae bacterium]|nr:type II secretion system protein [Woeseiaceae bacterium]
MNRQSGLSLVELLVSIVIVGIAAGTVLGVFSTTTGSSADPMIRHQAAAIAEAYLEEVLLRPVDDPDGVDGEVARADFDDVDDYDGLFDVGARDQFGTPIAALSAYSVSVSVGNSSALTGVPSGDTFRIDVLVTRGAIISYRLSGYRTRL